MEKDLLETFVMLAGVNNISKTAQALYISQAAVSHRLKKLEESVGAELVLRSKGAKQTQLTAAGRQFLPLAQNWLDIDREVENFQHRPQTLELTIGTVNSVNNYLFSEFYNLLKNDPLDWRLHIRTLHSADIYEQVRLNVLDIGFPLREQHIPNVRVRNIHSETLMVVSRHKINDKTVLMPSDLDGEKQIYINWGSDYVYWHSLYFPSYVVPKFSVDTAKIALDLLDDETWFFAPYSICLELRKKENCWISGLGVQTSARNLFMVTDKQTERTKRREIVLFKWRILHYIRKKERDFVSLLKQYHMDNQTEYVFEKDINQLR
ncbi:LysR family transcriptional regulator [Megasphaera hominis]|jgi:DNA-binding transcriptional LysR family regulator|uniref:LysR family transcriptional regulator n=1 Tax=Megasphaera hominis TaxID=159836 RepID=A0ABR6VJF4_9FIRM|nr:LysR family transcriptional regulator [Megasphaera hominis]MBC3537380.1 LysR family transcriptional regulator [Megasphaera hominis]